MAARTDDTEARRSLTPYVRVMGTYDFDVRSNSSSSDGTVGSYNTTGIQGDVGLDGYRDWQNTSLGVLLRGSYRHLTKQNMDDTDSETMVIGLDHRLSRRTVLSLSEMAGSSNRGLGLSSFGTQASSLLSGLNSSDLGVGDLVSSDMIDQRTYFSSTTARVNFQRSARLGFGFGGGGFLVRRELAGMPGLNGVNANAVVAYALSRRQTLSFQYEFTRYDYTNTFGYANMHMAFAGYAVRLNRVWSFELQAGATQTNIARTIRHSLSPDIAALLGQSYTTEAYRGDVLGWAGSTRLSARFRRSSLSFGGRRSISGGNGIYLTSRVDAASALYGYQLQRRCQLSMGTYYSRQTALSQTYAPLETVSATGSLSYRLSGSLFMTAMLTSRRFLNTVPGMRAPESMIASVGIGFTPTHGLPLW